MWWSRLLLAIFLINVNGQGLEMNGSSNFAVEGNPFNIYCFLNISNSPFRPFRGSTVYAHKMYDSSKVCYLSFFGCKNTPFLNSKPRNSRYLCDLECTDLGYTLNITITNVRKEDGGRWMCRIRPGPSTDYNLKVHFKPVITSMKFDPNVTEINEKTDITMTCEVDSVPPANITWYKNEKVPVGTGAVFTINNAVCNMTGNYTCKAQNDIGSVDSEAKEISVLCSPRIGENNPMTSVPAKVGETVELSVSVEAYPDPTFTWKHLLPDKSEKSLSDWRISTTSYGLTSKLILRNVSNLDFGNYIVYVENELGEISVTYTVLQTLEADAEKNQSSINKIIGIGFSVGVVVGFVAATVVLLGVFCLVRSRCKGFNTRLSQNQTEKKRVDTSDAVTSEKIMRQKRRNQDFCSKIAQETYESLDTDKSEDDKANYEDLEIYENQMEK